MTVYSLKVLIQYPNAAFKVPSLVASSRWLIVVNGRQMIDELRKAPDDAFSFTKHAADDVSALSLQTSVHCAHIRLIVPDT